MRIKKLQQELKSKKIDLVLIFSLDEIPNTNMKYFANYSGLGILAVTQKSSFLIVPEMEYEKALQTKLKVYNSDRKRRMTEMLSIVLKKKKISIVGIEEDKCSVFLYKTIKKQIKARYIDISSICANIRMIKDEQEIKYLKKACQITDNIFKKIYSNFVFKTEGQLKEFILSEINAAGCEPSFPPIVASANGSSMAHYHDSKKIRKGFLLLDFGAKYKGYCADMSRTLYVGKPSVKEVKIYNRVLHTLVECEKAVATIKKFGELYDQSLIELNEYSELMPHALGHGVGLDIHETPGLYTTEKKAIQENIVFTIEPGIYLLGKYGVRIEDTVVLRKKKLEILTKSKKELIVINKV